MIANTRALIRRGAPYHFEEQLVNLWQEYRLFEVSYLRELRRIPGRPPIQVVFDEKDVSLSDFDDELDELLKIPDTPLEDENDGQDRKHTGDYDYSSQRRSLVVGSVFDAQKPSMGARGPT